MSSDTAPVTIKKYANRRLYNTGTSAYVTLEDLAKMVKHGDDFVVFDAKSGDDITRSVLAQIIFEQEGKNGQSLLPTTFLRQLIRFYGDSMQMLVPSYLEFSLDKLAKEKNGFGHLFGKGALPGAARPMFAQIEEQDAAEHGHVPAGTFDVHAVRRPIDGFAPGTDIRHDGEGAACDGDGPKSSGRQQCRVRGHASPTRRAAAAHGGARS